MAERFFREPLDTYPIDLGYSECVLNYPPHYHPALEAIFIFSGSTQLVTDTGTVALAAGDIALISSLVIHGYSSTEQAEICTVIWDNDVFAEVEHFAFFNSRQQVLVLRDLDEDVHDMIVRHLAEMAYYQSVKDTPLCVNHSKILLIHLLREAVDHLEANTGIGFWGDAKISQAQEIRLFVQEHYTEALTLETVAKKLHSNKFEVSRTVNGILGTTISDLVNKYRLLEVCYLLETTRLSLPMIAACTGFSSESTLYRNFRKVFQCSPTKYRKEKRQ